MPSAPSRHFLIPFWPWPLLLALALAGVDELTKAWICQAIAPGHVGTVVVPGFFEIVHFRNPGAAWGILGEHTEILTGVSVLFAAVIAWHYAHLHENSRGKAVALVLIYGGLLGNLCDRLFRGEVLGRGEVVDFLSFTFGTYHYPAFNVADSAICVGTFLYLWYSWREAPAAVDDSPQTPSQPPSHAA